jgi:hypothetical protein
LELRYPGGEKYLRIGEAHGDVEPLAIQREMIRRTIKEHLDKEKRLASAGHQGTQSLFFIDAVDRYRQYDADGNPVKGDYARFLRRNTVAMAKHPDYQSLFGSGPDMPPPKMSTTAISLSTRRRSAVRRWRCSRTPRRPPKRTTTPTA